MADPETPVVSSWRPINRLLSIAAVAFGLAPHGAMAKPAQAVAPQAAPKAWLDYAHLMSDLVKARLAGDDPLAVRLRDYVKQLPGADSSDGVTLRIAFWIDAKSGVTRVDFPLFVHPEANADLHGLLVGLKLPAPPPKNMLLPLRLAVQIRPAEQPEKAAPAEVQAQIQAQIQAWNGRPAPTIASMRVGYDITYATDD